MNNNTNYSSGSADVYMDPIAVQEEMQKFAKSYEEFENLCDEFFKLKEDLSSWRSDNKKVLDAKLDALKPNFDQIRASVISYKNVANQSAESLIESEAQTASMLK